MNKLGAVIIVVAVVAACYLLLLVTMPILVDFASTANVTMAETSNLTNYPGAAEGVLMAPWPLFFAPAAIGIILIVMILRKP